MPTQKLNFIDNPLILQEKFVIIDSDNEEDEEEEPESNYKEGKQIGHKTKVSQRVSVMEF